MFGQNSPGRRYENADYGLNPSKEVQSHRQPTLYLFHLEPVRGLRWGQKQAPCIAARLIAVCEKKTRKRKRQ